MSYNNKSPLSNYLIILTSLLTLTLINTTEISYAMGGDRIQTIIAKPNSKISLNFNGNPTTGYQWYLYEPNKVNNTYIVATELKPLEENVNNKDLYMSTKHYKSAPVSKGELKVGVGGVFSFKFEVLDKLTETDSVLDFVYIRSFDETDGPTFSTVLVKIQNEQNENSNAMVLVDTMKKAEGKNQEEIKVAPSKTISLKFRGNASTGYNWYIVMNTVDTTSLTPMGLETQENTNVYKSSMYYEEDNSGADGAPGYSVFKFYTQKPSDKITLNFVYTRDISTEAWKLQESITSVSVNIEGETPSYEFLGLKAVSDGM